MLGALEWASILWRGLLVGGAVLGVFAYELQHDSPRHARSAAFSAVVFCQIFNAFSARSLTRTYFELGVRSNPKMLAVTAATAALQLALTALGPTQRLFDLGPFSARVVALGVAAGLIPVTVIEVTKLLRRAFGSITPR